MRKNYLVTTLLTTLALSGAANALVPSLDGNFTGSLEFSGEIFENSPHWLWEVPDEATAEFHDIELIKTDGVEVEGNLEFKFLENDIVFFHGRLDRMLARGGPGLTPVVRFNNVLYNNPGSGNMTVELDLNEGATGKLRLNIAGGGTTAHTSADGAPNRTPSDGSNFAIDHMIKLMEEVPGYHPTYTNVTNGSGVHPHVSTADSSLANENLTNIMQARAYYMREPSRLVVPANDVPSSWSATLPITVSLK